MASGLKTQYYDTNIQTTRLLGSTSITSTSSTIITDFTNPVTAGKNGWMFHFTTGNCVALTYQNASQEGTNNFRTQVEPPWRGTAGGIMHLFYGEAGGAGSGSIGPDFELDPITISNISVSSPNTTVAASRTFQVSGINQQVALRVTRGTSTATANVSVNKTYVRTGFSASGPWTTYELTAAGNRDINVTAGMYVQIGVEVTANGSGIGRSAYPVTVRNQTLGANIASFIVDVTADNDYIAADPHLDAIDWANISASTTNTNASTLNAEKTLTGINQAINLRATVTNLTGTAVTSGSRLEMYVDGAMKYHSTTLNNGAWCGGSVQPNEKIRFRAVINGVFGEQRNYSYTVTVTNVTTGATVDTFTVSQTVGVADTTADAITGLTPFVLTSDNHDVWIDGVPFRINGTNRPITIRIQSSARTGTAGSYVDVWRGGTAANAGSWTHSGYFDTGSSTNYIDLTVQAGEWLRIDNHTVTGSGRASAGFNYTITNRTTTQTLATVNSNSITVDNDNNYNVADYTPDAISFAAVNTSTNAETLTSYTQAYQITGINQTINLRHERYNPTTDSARPISTATMTVQRATSSSGPWTDVGTINIMAAGYQYVDLAATNGQWFRYKLTATTTTRSRYIQFDIAIHNLSVSPNVQLFRRNTNRLTVDADDNFNVSGSVNSVDWPNFTVSGTTDNAAGLPLQATSAARTISGLAAGQTATISLSGTTSGTAWVAIEPIKNGVPQGIKLLSQYNTTAVNNSYTPVTVQNGDSIAFRASVEGPYADSWNQYVYHQKTVNVTVTASAGGVIDTFSVNASYQDYFNWGGGGGGSLTS